MTIQYSDLTHLLDGLPLVEEDHVFAPVGPDLSPAVIELMNARANLLEPDAGHVPPDEEGDVSGGERALGESYTQSRDSLDVQISAQLAKDHPDAPRVRLRGLSDADFVEVAAELTVLAKAVENGDGPTRDSVVVESNLRYVARAFVRPEVTVDDVRVMRSRLNQGEWARLLDHVNRLAHADADQVTLPNS